MKTIYAFALGMWEFRNDWTTNFDHVGTDKGDTLQGIYDAGRDLAHRLTFRHFDQTI
jgi:hypothetical protein